MTRFKIGDIIINHWAGEGNPHKCGMYLGSNRFLRFNGNKGSIEIGGMTGKDDGMYEVIGHIDVKTQLAESFAAWNRRGEK